LIYECKAAAHRTDGTPPADPFSLDHTLKADAWQPLQVMSDALVCGSWTIPFSTIESAAFLFPNQRGRVLKLPVAILRVTSRGTTYDFSIMYTQFWRGALPFEVTRDGAPSSSLLPSVGLWLGLLVLAAGYVLWQLLSHR